MDRLLTRWIIIISGDSSFTIIIYCITSPVATVLRCRGRWSVWWWLWWGEWWSFCRSWKMLPWCAGVKIWGRAKYDTKWLLMSHKWEIRESEFYFFLIPGTWWSWGTLSGKMMPWHEHLTWGQGKSDLLLSLLWHLTHDKESEDLSRPFQLKSPLSICASILVVTFMGHHDDYQDIWVVSFMILTIIIALSTWLSSWCPVGEDERSGTQKSLLKWLEVMVSSGQFCSICYSFIVHQLLLASSSHGVWIPWWED